ncbi:MAG: hypothetical protein H0U95_02445 [Bacteroidetes bacterium]|nr:hypothetical protein [Bacteroidota bacterium]
MDKDLKDTEKNKEDGNHDFPGYPMYPTTDDIYSKLKEEMEIDPDNPTITKSKNDDPPAKFNEKIFKKDVTGDALNVLGLELDDEEELNNNYSLGGDNHE